MTDLIFRDEETQRAYHVVPLPVPGALVMLTIWGLTLVGAFVAGVKLTAETSIQYKEEAIVAHQRLDTLAVQAERLLRDATLAVDMTAEARSLMLDLLMYRDEMNARAREYTASVE